MRMQDPFAASGATGVDSIVLSGPARSTGTYTTSDIMGLLPEKASREAVRHATAGLVVQGGTVEQRAGILSMSTPNREHLPADANLAISKAKRMFIAMLREEISSWPMQPVTVKLFGSAARNEIGDGSDIALLVVVPDTWPEYEKHIQQFSSRASFWTENDVRPWVHTESEVADAPIFNSILTDGIDVAGDRNWLRRCIGGESTVSPKAGKVKTTTTDRHPMAGRLANAKQFLQVVEDAWELASDEEVLHAVLPLYVHAGIAAADAICAKNLNKHAPGEDHNAAVDLPASVDRNAASHLSTRLKLKGRAGDGHDSVGKRDLRSAERAATQLVAIASED